MKIQTDDKCWYAVYTAPRAEKKVSERLFLAGIEHYLPQKTVKRCWSDRIKEVIIPVINGYIFVNIKSIDYRKVTNVFGAIAFVREGGYPIPIPENQIKRMQYMVEFSQEPVEFIYEHLERGEAITISKGPLKGMMGELVQFKGKHKVVVRLARFGCAITTVPLSFIEKN